MKRLLALLSLVLLSTLVTAQSVLITPGAQSINGDSSSQGQLNAYGSGLVVGPKVKLSEEDPASNMHTMSCASEIFNESFAGTLKDPTGDAGYTGGILYDCDFTLYSTSASYLTTQIDFQVLDTESDGDTVYVLNYSNSEVLGAYSGNELPQTLFVNANAIRIKFKTDNDANVGAGFVLTWKSIIKDTTVAAIENYSGEGLVFDVGSNAFWSGKHAPLDFENRGLFSTAMGYNTNASGQMSTSIGNSTSASGFFSTAMGYKSDAPGNYSTAMGSDTDASGDYSTAMTYFTNASGDFSTAMGRSTTASGRSSTAMGNNTEASGYISTALGYESEASGRYSTVIGSYSKASDDYSTAIGYYTEASGSYSTALGTRASSNGRFGSMVLGDYVSHSANSLKADAGNRLLARFDNGYKFYTNNDLSISSIGLMALHNANSWSSISDSTKKENFIASNGEEVLKSVSQMRIGTWNYKGQNASKHRHWGVMAQDFHHHFGKDAYGTIGNDTTIATADFDGVSFAAIKALEERTRELQSDLASEMRFSASLELTTEKHEKKIEELQEQLQKQLQRNEAYESELLSMRSETMSVRAESRTVQAESKALKEDFKELKEMLLKSVAVKTK
ncbi:tail fiber domain-containing protein [Arcticibacterium luteifluviistationis]|uniref:Peptidase S74 domain-containing protein n=1 Tax=Arcticibacterium luteifluviistationis TaxID=1784714 RepID=A0A2Z4GGL2_9BACT|nr:tail fiber domain-containing protein [Arcticibacterium luteifluviistationis]AWW00218.1 hypothetical protein DJ013_19395 [Arcticibacterium luteifluviistationis]